MTFTKEKLIEQAKKNIEVLRGAVEKIPGASDAAVIHLKLAEIALASLEAEPVMYASSETLAYAKEGEQLLRTLSSPSGDCVIPLYSAPPAPVSVPDEVLARLEHEANHLTAWHHIDEHSCKVYRRDLLTLVNSCRAAMLQGAEPVSQRYKLPDGFDFDRFNDAVWLEAVESNPHMHSLTTSTIAMVALELNGKLAAGNSPVIPEDWVACTERMPDKLIPVMEFTEGQLTHIIESANEVITALAGTNEEVHPDDSAKMCAAWDHLNDEAAPPAVVKRLAEIALVERAELVAYRALEERLEAMLRPDCPGFEAVCRALWDLEPHRLLAHAGYAVDYDSQPTAVKATIKRKVFTILRATAKEVRGEG